MTEGKSHQQRHIDKILGNKEKPNDHSLANQSWQRATEDTRPRTMAPDEWDLWHKTHPNEDHNPTLIKPSLISKVVAFLDLSPNKLRTLETARGL